MAGGSGTTTAYHPTTQHQTHCQTPGWQSPRPRRMVRGPTPALEIVASFCKHIEQGHPWPNSTTHWRQLRIAKPGKSPNRISSSRPAQSWTGSGAHIESSSWHLGSNRSCRKSSMDVSKARAFTLLSYPTLLLLRPISAIPTKLKIIALWEVLASPRLSTRLAWKHSTAAMQRMGIPAGINNAIAAAWRQQQRWLTTANYVSNRPYPAQCLPQGDSASPTGLLATMSEAYRRIRAAHPQDQHGPQRHSIFFDRFWLTTRASTCVSIARAWQQATAQLNLGENASKADFNAFGHKNNVAALQDAITKLESQEPSDQGCESWVHSHNPTAEQGDLQMRRNTGSTKLLRSFGGRACSHTIPSKRQLLPKQLEWHLRLPPATADSQQQRASTHSVCLWRKSMVTLLSTVGHYFDYLLDTQQTLITELATS